MCLYQTHMLIDACSLGIKLQMMTSDTRVSTRVSVNLQTIDHSTFHCFFELLSADSTVVMVHPTMPLKVKCTKCTLKTSRNGLSAGIVQVLVVYICRS